MNPQISQETALLKDFVSQNNELGILVGSHQNLDTMAAALALYLSLTQAGKKVQIVSKKEPTVEFSNLVGIDKVSANFVGNTSKLVISLPYKKGEVEKVLFTEAPNTINFHLTAAPGQSITPFGQNEVKLNWEGGAPSAIITVGVGNMDELDGIVDANTVKIVNIDNYQGNSRYGDVVLVDESFSSLSEVVAKAIKDTQLPSDIDVAQNVLDGVLFATRNFTKPNTSPFAFEAASAAMYQGAQRRDDQQPQQQSRRDDQSQRPFDRAQGKQDFGGQPRQNQQDNRGGRDQRHQQPRQPRVNENDFPAMHMQGQQQFGGQPFDRAQGQQRQPQQNNPRMGNMPPRNMPNMGGGNQQPRSQQFGGGQPFDRAQGKPQRPQNNRPFGQNPNDIEDLMRKIKEENARHTSGNQQQFGRGQNQQNNYQDPISDGEIVDDPMNQPMNQPPMDNQMNQPMNQPPMDDMNMSDDQNYTPQDPSEVPDDWLMPKVFKSSKNNN